MINRSKCNVYVTLVLGFFRLASLKEFNRSVGQNQFMNVFGLEIKFCKEWKSSAISQAFPLNNLYNTFKFIILMFDRYMFRRSNIYF